MTAYRDGLERQLLARMRANSEALAAMQGAMSDHWGYEDPFYRFYHQSFKVYHVQDATTRAVALLQQLLPERAMNRSFVGIVANGTGRAFDITHNADWERHTRPMLEAFSHARFMIEMAVRYATLERPPHPLPSGYAALLHLFNIR